MCKNMAEPLAGSLLAVDTPEELVGTEKTQVLIFSITLDLNVRQVLRLVHSPKMII